MVLANGHAYQAGGAVYFDVSSWPAFGSISHYGRDEMVELAGERGGNPDDPNKADPLDFVLWQPSAPGEPAWDSCGGAAGPAGISSARLWPCESSGTTIDLHGGGSDLIFPHHECEAARSEAATGELFVRHWVHTGMVRYEGTKMSKSLGNLVFVRDLLKTWDPAAIRLAVLAHHYRSDWDWHDEPAAAGGHPAGSVAEQADTEAPRDQLARLARSAVVLDEVRAALDDDLDTPGAGGHRCRR